MYLLQPYNEDNIIPPNIANRKLERDAHEDNIRIA
jgi:hypothetical protein